MRTKLFPNPAAPVRSLVRIQHGPQHPFSHTYRFPPIPGGVCAIRISRVIGNGAISIIGREPFAITRTSAARMLRAARNRDNG